MFNRKTDRFSRSLFAKDILQHLRIGIISGEFAANTHLVEAQLAAEFGVSRGPVRSAIHALEQQGLVQSMPSGGAEVVGFTEKHANDFFYTRQKLEETAAALIVRRERLDLTRLRSITEDMAKKGGSIEYLHDLDMEFHLEFFRLADNWALLQLWKTLSPVISDMLTLTNSMFPDEQLIAKNHLAQLNAVEEKNLELLLKLIDEQMSLPKALISERFGQKGEHSAGDMIR